MNKHYPGQEPVGNMFLALEVCYRSDHGTRKLAVVRSIAGRPSVSIQRWTLVGFLPTEGQVTDMAAYVAKSVTDATAMFLGVQGNMPIA